MNLRTPFIPGTKIIRVGGMCAIADLQLPLRAIAVVASTENMPSGHAYRPGDIIRAANGKTIEVTNTDAEGRLVLADALWYARENGATHVLDKVSFEVRPGEMVAMLGNGTRLLTLTGPGGSGKTRLAIEAAVELLPSFKNGAFWVGLATIRDPALVMEADGVAFDRIVSNLIINALRYGQTPIAVSASTRDRHFRLTVEDSGPGIPEDLQPQLFERFTRGDSVTKSGAGLGLSIARSYARFKEDAAVAVQMIMAEERERWMSELYARRQVACVFHQ